MNENKKNSSLTIILIVVGVIGVVGICFLGLLVAIAVPGFMRARETSRLNACMENQAKLDGAAQQFILENNLDQLSDTPFAGKDADSNSAAVLFGNSNYLTAVPVCRSGGTYTFLSTDGSVGESIMCDHDGNQDGVLDHPYPNFY